MDIATSSTLLLKLAQAIPNLYSPNLEPLINMALFATEFLVGAVSGTCLELKETAEGLVEIVVGTGQLAVDFFSDPVNTALFVKAAITQLYEHGDEVLAAMGEDVVDALAVESAEEAGKLTGRVVGAVLTGVIGSKAVSTIKRLTKVAGEMKAAIKVEARLEASLGKQLGSELAATPKSLPSNITPVPIDTAEKVVDSVGAEAKKFSWGGLKNYNKGGPMTVVEHINYRHAYDTGSNAVSKFSKGTSLRNIKEYVETALEKGYWKPNGKNGFEVDFNLGREIGTTRKGDPASTIRVFIRDGEIQTAFPVGN